MDYGLIKTLHILSATVLFGTGLGTAYFMWSASRTRDARVIASVARHVVRADWVFTTPTVIFQPLSGIWLVHAAGYPWTGWVGLSLVLYVFGGLCWLPVVWLQIRMRDAAQGAALQHRPLPHAYWRDARIWFWLGVPAFVSMVGVFFLMVSKHV
jgi:uncharacterized membrane protein